MYGAALERLARAYEPDTDRRLDLLQEVHVALWRSFALFDGGALCARKVEYTLAGERPILHYHARPKTVSHLAMEQFPLGLFANATFENGVAEVEPGDILALLTDGLVEVTDANDEQFGLERISEIVVQNAAGPLADLTETLFAAVRRYGRQDDDETLILVRANRRKE